MISIVYGGEKENLHKTWMTGRNNGRKWRGMEPKSIDIFAHRDCLSKPVIAVVVGHYLSWKFHRRIRTPHKPSHRTPGAWGISSDENPIDKRKNRKELVSDEMHKGGRNAWNEMDVCTVQRTWAHLRTNTLTYSNTQPGTTTTHTKKDSLSYRPHCVDRHSVRIDGMGWDILTCVSHVWCHYAVTDRTSKTILRIKVRTQ